MAIARNYLSTDAAAVLSHVEQVDICIIVPKRDEFEAHLEVFRIDEPFDELAWLRGDDRYPFAVTKLSGLIIALICMDGQGNTESGICAREILTTLSPAHIYLSGTSLGNRGRTGLGSVRVADRVMHAAQWVDRGADRVPRWNHYEVPAPLRRDFGNFARRAPIEDMRQTLASRLRNLYPESWEAVMRSSRIDVDLAPMVSDNELYRSDGRRIWMYDEASASYDMESGGFAKALMGEPEISWAVIRGISDFGDDKAAAELGGRELAASAAAVFLHAFIRDGLRKSHPLSMRPSQTVAPRLSSGQHYNKYSASAYFRRRIKELLNLDLPLHEFLSRELTLDDLAVMCGSPGMSREHVIDILRNVRNEYFEDKYLDYTYDLDLRGYVTTWHEELRELLASYMRESPYRATIADVGCGNGLELRPLFEGADRVIGVDLSQRMLDRAASVFEGLELLRSDAQNLSAIPSESIDMYVSLRTYMSRFFDVPAALREAYRVLKPGGLLVLSIAAGYLDYVDGQPTIIKGLKEANGSEFVDIDRPVQLLAQYHRQLNGLGFEFVSFSYKATDVYIGGRKPGDKVPSSPRISE